MAQQVVNQEVLRHILTFIRDTFLEQDDFNIVTTFSDTNTNLQVPGALAMYEWITEALGDLEHVRMTVVTTLPATGETNVIYLVGVPPVFPATEITSYRMNAWIAGAWVFLGTTDLDLMNYWSKTELVMMTTLQAQEIINDVMGV